MCCYGEQSVFGVDWPKYTESNCMHQCDQAINSVMLMRYQVKTYPWWKGGHGAGSDDEMNTAQRVESNIPAEEISFNPPCYLDTASLCS